MHNLILNSTSLHKCGLILLFLISAFWGALLAISVNLNFNGTLSTLGEVSFDATHLTLLVEAIWFTIITVFASILLLNIIQIINRNQSDTAKVKISSKCQHQFFLSAAMALFIIYLPCLLTFYPGGIYADTVGVINMALGKSPVTNKQPVLYTLMWRIVLDLFNKRLHVTFSASIFIFTLLTALLMCLSEAYFLFVCYKHNVSKYLITIFFAFFALYKIIPLYIVSLWKDTTFGCFILFYSVVLLDIFWDSEANFSKRNCILYSAASFLCLFCRNNAVYALFLTSFAISLHLIKRRKRHSLVIFLRMTACIYIIFLIIRIPVFNFLEMNSSDAAESIGVPLQQMGYMLSVGSPISSEDMKVCNSLMPLDAWKNQYRPFLVDNVKWSPDFDTAYLNDHFLTVIKTYLHMVITNPIDAAKGWLLTTMGFWDPLAQTSDAYINNFMWPWVSSIDPSISMKNVLYSVTGISLNGYYQISHYISAAVFGWLTLFLTIFNRILFPKDSRRLSLIPCLGLWLTLIIASPIAFSLRYMFFAILTIPLACVLLINPGDSQTLTVTNDLT